MLQGQAEPWRRPQCSDDTDVGGVAVTTGKGVIFSSPLAAVAGETLGGEAWGQRGGFGDSGSLEALLAGRECFSLAEIMLKARQ